MSWTNVLDSPRPCSARLASAADLAACRRESWKVVSLFQINVSRIFYLRKCRNRPQMSRKNHPRPYCTSAKPPGKKLSGQTMISGGLLLPFNTVNTYWRVFLLHQEKHPPSWGPEKWCISGFTVATGDLLTRRVLPGARARFSFTIFNVTTAGTVTSMPSWHEIDEQNEGSMMHMLFKRCFWRYVMDDHNWMNIYYWTYLFMSIHICSYLVSLSSNSISSFLPQWFRLLVEKTWKLPAIIAPQRVASRSHRSPEKSSRLGDHELQPYGVSHIIYIRCTSHIYICMYVYMLMHIIHVLHLNIVYYKNIILLY